MYRFYIQHMAFNKIITIVIIIKAYWLTDLRTCKGAEANGQYKKKPDIQ